MKKRSERREHCALAVIRRRQKFSPRCRPPFRGRRTAKIYSAGDGHYLYQQTQFGEDRCTQFRVIVVADPQTHTNKQTHRQDRLQYTAPLSLARSVMIGMSRRTFVGLPSYPTSLCKESQVICTPFAILPRRRVYFFPSLFRAHPSLVHRFPAVTFAKKTRVMCISCINHRLQKLHVRISLQREL